MGTCNVSVFQYIYPTRCNVIQFIYIWKLLYIFRVVLSPIIRREYNCIYSIWYLSHRYCYLLLSWKSWNWFECALGGVGHSQHKGCRPKNVEQLRNIAIINSTTRSHLVGSFYEIYITMDGSMNIKFNKTTYIIKQQDEIFILILNSSKIKGYNLKSICIREETEISNFNYKIIKHCISV